MERGGLKSVVVYDGASCLGQLDTIPVKDKNFQFPNNEIRIHHLSPRSERCPPISVLQTISPFSVRCKLQSSSPIEQTQLLSLHSSCFHEAKTAVVLLGEEEIHLVAMGSKQKNYPCFWCYSVPCGLYNSCLGMLNLRCLSIVFDLDETLIVANTMKSFEDRIEALRSWIARETDPVRILGMSAEMQRYAEDRAFLKQYIDNDCVVDHGKVYKVQGEEVPKVVEGQDRIVRPVVRLLEKNIVLTRINPEIRDTSVLVRLRPAWEDLRSYLIAKGRKRFEVYVCTMAERDYALEMWRLLDPETHLIASEKLLDRVVCVNSGAKKSLHNVFKDGNCHPKMAMVIDDRVKVWEDKDQPRVHLVPAFSPYYAPQAETANAVPVLCVARNVACNVRGGFFREFDENLLPRISELFYEDEFVNLPFAPDASNYLMPEDEKANVNSAICPITNIPELGSGISQQSVATTPNGLGPASLRPLEQPSLLGAPLRRDMMNNNQDLHYRGSREPPLLSRMPGILSGSSIQPQEGWLAEEINRGRFNNQRSGTVHGSDMLGAERHRVRQSSLIQSKLEEKSQEEYHGRELRKQNLPPTTKPSDISIHSSSKSREVQTEGGKVNSLSPSLYIGVLQEFGQRCNSKVEFRSVVSTSENLQFSVEVLFTGERIGFGMGKTRKDAQQQGAENALRSLADEYISYVGRRSGAVDTKLDELSVGNDKGFLWDSVDGESDQRVNAELVKEGTSEVRHGTPSIVRSIQ